MNVELPVQGYESRASIYDLEFTEERQFGFFRRVLGEVPLRLLELPCGTGRAAATIASWGHEVTAMDIEPLMVQAASDRAISMGLNSMSVVVGDMRHPQLARQFDAIVIGCEAFQFLLSDDCVQTSLRNLSAHLGEKGRIIIDLSRFGRLGEDPELEYFDPALPEGVETLEWERAVGSGPRIRRYRVQGVGAERRIKISLRYECEGACGFHSSMEFRVFMPGEFEQHARAAGLKIISTYGGYDFRAPGSAAPREIHILAHGGL